MSTGPGTLFVVATPIGNLDDLTARARQVLADVDLVAAEDTRRARQLLTALGIRKRLISLHDHNEEARSGEVLAALGRGEDVALISDAGTPLISDPGFRVVAALRDSRWPVVPVPGCSAVLAALSVAGLPTDRFRFEGFLPARATARRRRLTELRDCPDTLVMFEAVHRIDAALQDLAAAFGADRPMTAARELTKRHETLYRGTIDEISRQIAEDSGSDKGEYTLVIGPAEAGPGPDEAELERVLGALLESLAPSQAAQLAARLTGATRSRAYALAERLKSGSR